MKITIICVGRLKEEYWEDAVKEYSKRIGKYAKLEIIELADEKTPENSSIAQDIQIKNKEGQKILKTVKEGDFVITLEVLGSQLTSEGLADFFDKKMICGISKLTFIIGGSLGLSSEVIERSDYSLSFSCMTFPHQMMRVILLEQIYRAMKINKNEPYHK